MIRHLWKLIWNRKKHHLLIVLEIMICFLAAFAAIAMGGNYLVRYGTPLGFSYQNVWMINVNFDEMVNLVSTGNVEKKEERIGRMYRLAEVLEDFPEVSASALVGIPPYNDFSMRMSYRSDRTNFGYGFDSVSDTFPDTMDLQIIRGRSFGREDDGRNYDPVIINREFAEKAFGSEDPLGKSLGDGTGPDGRSSKIVGIFTDYRGRGELAATGPFAIFRLSRDNPRSFFPTLLVRVRPGTSLAFEEKIVNRLQSMEKEWSFDVRPLEVQRRNYLKMRILPLIILGVGAFFMILMVGSGLFGVLWMNVVRRTQEIGLRRAHGATAFAVCRQFLIEMLLIATLGIGLGSLLLLPLMPILAFMSIIHMGTAFGCFIISALLIYGIVAFCALYPAIQATCVHPAEALHYE